MSSTRVGKVVYGTASVRMEMFHDAGWTSTSEGQVIRMPRGAALHYSRLETQKREHT